MHKEYLTSSEWTEELNWTVTPNLSFPCNFKPHKLFATKFIWDKYLLPIFSPTIFLWSLKLVEIYAQARWNNRKKQNTPFTGRWWIWNEKELGFLKSKQKKPHNDVNNPCVCVRCHFEIFPTFEKAEIWFCLKISYI